MISMQYKGLLLTLILAGIPVPSYAQDVHSAVRSSMLNSTRAILYKSNPEAIKKLDELKAQEERNAGKAKRHLEMFLKCDGNKGNANMDLIYGDPDHYMIKDGKCVYLNSYAGGH